MSSQSKEDVVIVGAFRTPIGRAKRGVFSTLKNDLLVSQLIEGSLYSLKMNPSLVDEVLLGHCLSPLNGTTSLRMASLRGGIPLGVPVSTVNRQCASGLESMSILCNKIKLDQIRIGVGGGFESMSSYSLPSSDAILLEGDSQEVKDCTLSMGDTAEILASRHNITRSKCDVYAFTSHKKALEAQRKGKTSSEIVKIRVGETVVEEDECVRETSLERLKDLKPVFKERGVCTAGNTCQLGDGASLVVLMKRRTADTLGLKARGRVVDYTVVGVEPRVMGEGPVPTITLLLKKNNLRVEDVSYFEINEAFACQAVYCIEELGIDYRRVNRYGGSIGLGHPLGSTGSKLVCTLLNVMEREGMRGYGVVSLCVGTGLGVAMLLFKE